MGWLLSFTCIDRSCENVSCREVTLRAQNSRAGLLDDNLITARLSGRAVIYRRRPRRLIMVALKLQHVGPHQDTAIHYQIMPGDKGSAP